MRALWIQPRSATGVGVGRVNFAKASGFDADGINRKTILFFTGFPSKLENDGAGRRRPPEGAGTLRRQNQRRRESRGTKATALGIYTSTTKGSELVNINKTIGNNVQAIIHAACMLCRRVSITGLVLSGVFIS